MLRRLPLFLLLALASACAGPRGRAADGDDQAVLDQVPSESEAAAQAEREIDERNAQSTLDEIRRELGGR